jgi:hypothetical protein
MNRAASICVALALCATHVTSAQQNQLGIGRGLLGEVEPVGVNVARSHHGHGGILLEAAHVEAPAAPLPILPGK